MAINGTFKDIKRESDGRVTAKVVLDTADGLNVDDVVELKVTKMTLTIKGIKTPKPGQSVEVELEGTASGAIEVDQ